MNNSQNNSNSNYLNKLDLVLGQELGKRQSQGAFDLLERVDVIVETNHPIKVSELTQRGFSESKTRKLIYYTGRLAYYEIDSLAENPTVTRIQLLPESVSQR